MKLTNTQKEKNVIYLNCRPSDLHSLFDASLGSSSIMRAPESISSKVMSSRFIITRIAVFLGLAMLVEIGASPIMLFFRFQNPLMWYKEESSFPLFCGCFHTSKDP